jgi:hypothetical protein
MGIHYSTKQGQFHINGCLFLRILNIIIKLYGTMSRHGTALHMKSALNEIAVGTVFVTLYKNN